MKDIIKFENISKNFGAVHALKEVSFSVRKGECHAIIGENGAGKSTLMHILAGAYLPSNGCVYIKDKEVQIINAAESKKLGISIVYQELKLCPNLTASENVFLGKIPTGFLGTVKKDNIDRQVKELVSQFGVDIDVTVPVINLGSAQMQLIEIAKAIMEDAEILILDEPTSSLTAAEADVLFKILRDLKKQGKTLIFISHRMNEIFEMADRITIMRDGSYIGTYEVQDIDEKELVKLIAGNKRFSELYAEEIGDKEVEEKKDVLLEVNHMSCGTYVNNESFVLHKGEILGLYGLQGSGRTELVESIFGLHGKVEGEIKVKGKTFSISKPADAIKAGFGLVTEDRKNRGIYALMNIRENIAAIHREKITDARFVLNSKKIDSISNEYVKALSVKIDSLQESILNLSGGNQQKVILARMLSTNPEVVLMDEPTRGVDVGAKAEIFSIIKELKEQGKGILVISSELQEVVKECDRILVLRNGKIVGEVISRENRENDILQLAFNG